MDQTNFICLLTFIKHYYLYAIVNCYISMLFLRHGRASQSFEGIRTAPRIEKLSSLSLESLI